jgi:hypothetical protein
VIPIQAATRDFSGYSFWLDKLNSFNGNFENAEMVKAFLASTEYHSPSHAKNLKELRDPGRRTRLKQQS